MAFTNRISQFLTKIAFGASPRLYGRFSSGAGVGEEIGIGDGLVIESGSLKAVAVNLGNLTTSGFTTGHMLRIKSGGGIEGRTTAQVLSDIGAQAALTNYSTITGLTGFPGTSAGGYGVADSGKMAVFGSTGSLTISTGLLVKSSILGSTFIGTLTPKHVAGLQMTGANAGAAWTISAPEFASPSDSFVYNLPSKSGTFAMTSDIPSDVVLTSPQTLTEEEQAAARENIGAMAGTNAAVVAAIEDDPATILAAATAVSYEPRLITTTQQKQARDNIAVALSVPKRGKYLPALSDLTYSVAYGASSYSGGTTYTWAQIKALARLGGATDLITNATGWSNCRPIGQTSFNPGKVPQTYALTFLHLGQDFEVRLIGSGAAGPASDFVMLVDGNLVAQANDANGATYHYHKYDFGSVALREITLIPGQRAFDGMNVAAGSGTVFFPARQPYSKKCVCFGDSITYGYYISYRGALGWAQRLRTKMGWNVFDSGVTSETTIQAQARVADDIIAVAPDYVIWNHGANDAADYATNATAALAGFNSVKSALPNCKQIYFNRFTGRNSSQVTLMQAACASAGILFVDSPTGVVPTSDGIHPTVVGAEYLADWVCENLIANGFITTPETLP